MDVDAGIILWELLTRQQPYAGLSPAAVAVAVIRDNLRPTIPDEHGAPAEFEALMTSCWNVDPVIRPAFLEIMTRLSTGTPTPNPPRLALRCVARCSRTMDDRGV